MIKTVMQERKKVYAPLQCAAIFHCQLENWIDCDELKPKHKEKWVVADTKRRM